MKFFRVLICTVATFVTVSLVTAQSTPYNFNVGMHAVNYNTSEYFKTADWQWGIPRLAVSAPFANRWSFMPSLSFGKITDPGNNNGFFWDFDASVKYDLTERKLQPYLVAGLGVGGVKDNTNTILTGGVGVNYWFTKTVGLNFQTNYDYVPDFENYWHNSVGLAFKWGGGPKDSDKDGIPDDRDACPKLAGVASAQGCPDSDGDGVKDADDQCPSEAGTPATFGCPDSDGDGIPNAKDECPTVAGIAQFNGCPDSDGDGIPDKSDACPKDKGLQQFNGCPDSDGDGVMDKEDKCPQVKGAANLQGCPDRDSDGVADADDNCPDLAGTVAKKGCPEIKDEEVKAIETQLNIAAKRIQFETGSSKIREISYKEIDQIISIMNKYSFTKFDIEGHTDNIGNADNNRKLSQSRADAVKDYIMSHGIAADRMTAMGYGADRPLGSNATADGRAQNRRVEIHLKKD